MTPEDVPAGPGAMQAEAMQAGAAPVLSLSGEFFAGGHSRAHAATLRVVARSGEAWAEVCPNEARPPRAPLLALPLRDCRVEAPVAGLERQIHLGSGSGGSFFMTDDQAGADELARLRRRSVGSDAAELVDQADRALSRVESRWSLALLALGLTVAFGAWVVLDGLPRTARTLALRTPPSVLQSFDEQTVDLMAGGGMLTDSRLPEPRRREVEALFGQLTSDLASRSPQGQPAYRYRLLIRHGGEATGANAFALPYGTVFVTDELIEEAYGASAEADAAGRQLAEQGLAGVLAHEIGHVEQRHSLSGIYQSLGVAVLMAAATGDVVSAGSVAAGAPVFFLERGYSRQAEYQADLFGGEYLMNRYGTTRGLRELLVRLDGGGPEPGGGLEGEEADEAAQGQGSGWEELLLDHPDTAKRVQRLQSLERLSAE